MRATSLPPGAVSIDRSRLPHPHLGFRKSADRVARTVKSGPHPPSIEGCPVLATANTVISATHTGQNPTDSERNSRARRPTTQGGTTKKYYLAPYLSTEEFPERGQGNKQPTRPPQQSLSTLISSFGNSSVHQPLCHADSLFASRKAHPNPNQPPCGVRTSCSQPLWWKRSPHGGWNGRARDEASHGAGVAQVLAHRTSIKSSPTLST